jgi:Cu(I)/Ag(I) efflux system protein CusF
VRAAKCTKGTPVSTIAAAAIAWAALVLPMAASADARDPERALAISAATTRGAVGAMGPASIIGNVSHAGGRAAADARAVPNLRRAEMSEGEVRKVDETVGKLTLRHAGLENLDMPPMTMVFRVKDPGWLPRLKVGDTIRFHAERVDGNLTITALERETEGSP